MTDFRYVQQVSKQAPDFTLLQNKREIFAEINDLVAHKTQKVNLKLTKRFYLPVLRISAQKYQLRASTENPRNKDADGVNPR